MKLEELFREIHSYYALIGIKFPEKTDFESIITLYAKSEKLISCACKHTISRKTQLKLYEESEMLRLFCNIYDSIGYMDCENLPNIVLPDGLNAIKDRIYNENSCDRLEICLMRVRNHFLLIKAKLSDIRHVTSVFDKNI